MSAITISPKKLSQVKMNSNFLSMSINMTTSIMNFCNLKILFTCINICSRFRKIVLKNKKIRLFIRSLEIMKNLYEYDLSSSKNRSLNTLISLMNKDFNNNRGLNTFPFNLPEDSKMELMGLIFLYFMKKYRMNYSNNKFGNVIDFNTGFDAIKLYNSYEMIYLIEKEFCAFSFIFSNINSNRKIKIDFKNFIGQSKDVSIYFNSDIQTRAVEINKIMFIFKNIRDLTELNFINLRLFLFTEEYINILTRIIEKNRDLISINLRNDQVIGKLNEKNLKSDLIKDKVIQNPSINILKSLSLCKKTETFDYSNNFDLKCKTSMELMKKALINMDKLHTLNISGNYIGFELETVRIFCEYLVTCKNLKILDMSNNFSPNKNEKGKILFFNSFLQQTSITDLLFDDNGLGLDKSFLNLFLDFIKTYKILKKISIQKNSLGVERHNAKLLTETLELATNLGCIYLDNNYKLFDNENKYFLLKLQAVRKNFLFSNNSLSFSFCGSKR